MASDAPDFSPLAAAYARARPRYPRELYDWLAAESPSTELAWDCATGSGQAAIGVAERFRRVVATDLSEEQIGHAHPHPRVEYRVARAESSGLPDGAVDLVTVAAAAHWFDVPAFGAEAARVLRPGGLLAVWSYHAGIAEAPFDRVFDRLYVDVLKPYFASGARYVDERYETLDLPGTPVAAPRFEIVCRWTLAQTLDYIGSWSATASYRRANGRDPVDAIRSELESLFDREPGERTLRLPIFLRVQRLGAAASRAMEEGR
ncbi:MAG: class I SAM-dependent methyltransferase [Acidobacteria bacterium]|nr:class I SAM-dependent methyltransferase [Acidobacteriota bacterium]